MRKTLLSLTIGVSLAVSSAAFAGPPCRTDVGGVCGADYDGWMATYHRTNPGKVIMPMSPGGYGILPNGQVFNQGQGGVYYQNGGRPGVITRTVLAPEGVQGGTYQYGNPVQQGNVGVPGMIQRTIFAITHREGHRFRGGMQPRFQNAPQPMQAMTEQRSRPAPVAAQSAPLSAADVALLQSVYQ